MVSSNFQPTQPADSAASPSRAASMSAKSPFGSFSSDPGYQSPHRHHFRVSSTHQQVKETRNARSEYSQDDGSSQLRINQYLIRQEIGRGSFGAVHLATDQYDTEYAVKEFSKSRLRRRAKSNLLRRPRNDQPNPSNLSAPNACNPASSRGSRPPSPMVSEENSFDLIKEEIAVMKKLHHPNLVALIEVLDDPDEDSLFMVLEMCKKGVIMKVEVEDDVDPYSEHECRTWFRDLILAIEYLHAQGIIHRDIKPDNCLLTSDDVLKVVDFGVSEMFEKSSEMRIAKSAGSPAFMAPELCVVKHGNVSGRPADIWSMGVTLYCLRFGRVPFRRNAVLDLYNSILSDQVPLEAGCAPDFADLIRRILEKDPEKRITMEQLREHPWVTSGGTDPLLPASENCAELVTPPTDSEMNAAITSNVGRVIAVMKAAHRFKRLVDRKRPELVNSILGHASRFVKPPSSISRHHSPYKLRTNKHAEKQRGISPKDWQAAKKALEEEGDKEGAEIIEQLDRLPDDVRTALVSETAAQEDELRQVESPTAIDDTSPALSPSPPAHHHKAQTTSALDSIVRPEPGKGHARDPLAEQLYLNIGQGPTVHNYESADDSVDPASLHILSESPPPVGNDLFERAYDEEVDSIFRRHGHAATVYLTRRVEKMRPKLDYYASEAQKWKGEWSASARQRVVGYIGEEAVGEASRASESALKSAKSGWGFMSKKAWDTASAYRAEYYKQREEMHTQDQSQGQKAERVQASEGQEERKPDDGKR